MKNQKIKIVFWGTPYFGAKILEALIQEGFLPVLVVTSPDKPCGRGLKIKKSAVKEVAEKWHLKIAQPEKLKNNKYLLNKIIALKPDLYLLASYGKIIPKEYLDIPLKGALNIHPSLLPRWRGPSPIQATILNNDQETGVTIILMDEKMDHGPIIGSSTIKIENPKIVYKELEEILIQKAIELLKKVLPEWLEGKIKPIPQKDEEATYCSTIKKEDGKIDFQEPAEIIERKIRAYETWPKVWFEKGGKIFKILKAEIIKDDESTKNKSVGEFFLLNKNLAVKCKKDVLIIGKIQPENKKILNGYEFWCGYQKYLR